MNVYKVYADNADQGRYVDAPDEATALAAGSCWFGIDASKLTARYVLSSGNPDKSIKQLNRMAKGLPVPLVRARPFASVARLSPTESRP